MRRRQWLDDGVWGRKDTGGDFRPPLDSCWNRRSAGALNSHLVGFISQAPLVSFLPHQDERRPIAQVVGRRVPSEHDLMRARTQAGGLATALDDRCHTRLLSRATLSRALAQLGVNGSGNGPAWPCRPCRGLRRSPQVSASHRPHLSAVSALAGVVCLLPSFQGPVPSLLVCPASAFSRDPGMPPLRGSVVKEVNYAIG